MTEPTENIGPRETSGLTQAEREIVRSKAGMAQRRGLIIKRVCEDCADPNTEMHHPDYSKPYDVVWLCRKCHLRRHADGRGAEPSKNPGAPVRRYTWGGSTKCSRCSNERAPRSRYCRPCRSAYMRAWRKRKTA